MTDKTNFTPEEWKLLLESVMMAGIAVSAAEPSGLWGLLKESFASGNALLTAKMDPGSDALIKAVVADFETAEGRSTARDGLKEKFTGNKPAEIKARCIETLQQAGALVDTKAPGDAAAFKGMAAPDQPARCGSIQGGRISWHRRGPGERSGEGNAHGDFECPQTGGMIRCVHSSRRHFEHAGRAILSPWKPFSSKSLPRLLRSVR